MTCSARAGTVQLQPTLIGSAILISHIFYPLINSPCWNFIYYSLESYDIESREI